jgi:hypothetical protein
MLYGFAADLIVLIHLGFILFVVFGGFLVRKWRWIIYLHLPTVFWGIIVEFTGWTCPLTPWEQSLRSTGGQAGYHGSFIEHYLVPAIYPAHLTRELQYGLGIFVILINLTAYGLLIRRNKK